ncbi:MAG: signal peptidase I, partial [Caldilineaceae bacterium]
EPFSVSEAAAPPSPAASDPCPPLPTSGCPLPALAPAAGPWEDNHVPAPDAGGPSPSSEGRTLWSAYLSTELAAEWVLPNRTLAAAPALAVGDPAELAPRESADAGWVEMMARTVGLGRDLLAVAVPAVLLAIVVHLFLAQATVVFGQSMEPNLSPHQRLIVDKLSYRLHAPQRNDIVVVDLPQLDDMLVKRVVGLPGETIELRGGLVHVNGAPLLEPFAHALDAATTPPVTLADGEYYVLGDNRDNSNDSRYFGPIAGSRILGKVWLRYWPLHRFRLF